MDAQDPALRVLLTGAAGFAGSHCLTHLLKSTQWFIICPVSFKHRGLPERLVCAVEQGGKNGEYWSRVQVFKCDLSCPISNTTINLIGPVDCIINYAAESHVERSIEEPVSFIQNNVDLTLNIFEFARKVKPRIVFLISTDEVYGAADPNSKFCEWAPIVPSSPYSASKAAQESIAICYWRTFAVPLVIMNCVNLIGEMQDPEKFVPKIILRIVNGQEVSIQVGPHGTIGSRSYLHAGTLAEAVLFLAKRGNVRKYSGAVDDVVMPDRYNVEGDREINNLEMAQIVAHIVGKPLKYKFADSQLTRPGHDLRYALDGSKLKSLGFKSEENFENSLHRLIKWTVAQQKLWRHNNGIGNAGDKRNSMSVANGLSHASEEFPACSNRTLE